MVAKPWVGVYDTSCLTNKFWRKITDVNDKTLWCSLVMCENSSVTSTNMNIDGLSNYVFGDNYVLVFQEELDPLLLGKYSHTYKPLENKSKWCCHIYKDEQTSSDALLDTMFAFRSIFEKGRKNNE